MGLIFRWLAAAAAVAAAAYLVPGIRVNAPWEAYLLIALIMGLVNALVRPVLGFLSCGLIVLTLGLFLIVINAAMLMLTAWASRAIGIAFEIDSFGSALLGAIVISLVSFLSSLLFEPERK